MQIGQLRTKSGREDISGELVIAGEEEEPAGENVLLECENTRPGLVVVERAAEFHHRSDLVCGGGGALRNARVLNG